jgi:hypothetical protein
MTSVERIERMCCVAQEAAAVTSADPSGAWPEQGEVRVSRAY